MSAEGDNPAGVVELAQLRLPAAIAFSRFLDGPDVNDTARLARLHQDGESEMVFFTIDVPLPQYPVADIQATELVGVLFTAGHEPAVFSGRETFPRLAHQNLQTKNEPRSLCLNATPWSESKQRWSPSLFLEQIRDWLMKASVGRLHAPGQPREPLFVNPAGYLIVPHDADLSTADGLAISGDLDYTPHTMWATPLAESARPGKGHFKLFSFRAPAREHGLIDTLPRNLFELHELCSAHGLDLIGELSKRLRGSAPAGSVSGSMFEHQMLLHLQQQLTPGAGSNETTDEEWCFMVSESTIQKIAEILNVSTFAEGFTAPVLVQTAIDPEITRKVLIFPIAILRSMTPAKARQHNAVAIAFPKVAVLGAGALGSKVLENLARAGLEEGVIIDNDRLNPHNTARHSLSGGSVGHFKAEELARQLNHVLDSRSTGQFRGVLAKFRKDSDHSEMRQALREAEFILDFSASVSVARELSDTGDCMRVFSAFLTPGGNSLIVNCEDADRGVRLDWLEAITLREIVLNMELHSCYSSEAGEIWYGGACREVSTVLPNYKVSIFSAVAANVFAQHHEKKGALCDVFVLDPGTMAVTPVNIEPTEPIEVQCEDWTVRYDLNLVSSLKAMRLRRLPNETGGILLGSFDRERKICSIVLASDSPADSVSWPTEYIRGVVGLKSLVDDVAKLTAKQLQYVGEWHSHPSGCTSEPSALDREAVGNLKLVLGREGYPAIALIVSEDPLPHVLFDQWL